MTHPETSRIVSSAALAPEVVAFAERIPLFSGEAVLHIEPLQGVISLNNTIYRLTVNNTPYFLRIASPTAHVIGVRPAEEQEAILAAARVGVAPELLYAEPEGHLLMQWISGRHWQPEDFHRPENIVRLAETLQRLHGVTTVQGDGSVFRRIERLLSSAKQLHQELPPNLDAYLTQLSAIEAARRADASFTPCLAHNDFWANNFLDDGQKLWLVDWEFAGNGDGLYDLATASLNSQYDAEEQAAFLNAYGETATDRLNALASMQYVVFFFEAVWSLVQHGVRGSDSYDYQGYAQRMFARMES